MTAAVFLDRDGVINEDWFNPATGEWESPLHPDDLVLRPGVLDAIARLRDLGFRLFLVSNQPSYAKGKCRLEDLQAVQARLKTLLDGRGVGFDAFYYSYSHPESVVPELGEDAIFDRKPEPWFLFQARDRFGIDLAASWMIGDRDSDVTCGRRAGTRTIQVANPRGTKAGKADPDARAAGLPEAVALIETALAVTAGERKSER
jgi:D-glycero-D-manno-heptose 1,7-bisphosphate phosphatase